MRVFSWTPKHHHVTGWVPGSLAIGISYGTSMKHMGKSAKSWETTKVKYGESTQMRAIWCSIFLPTYVATVSSKMAKFCRFYISAPWSIWENRWRTESTGVFWKHFGNHSVSSFVCSVSTTFYNYLYLISVHIYGIYINTHTQRYEYTHHIRLHTRKRRDCPDRWQGTWTFRT